MLALKLILIILLLTAIAYGLSYKSLTAKPRQGWMIWVGVILVIGSLWWSGYEASVLEFNMETKMWHKQNGLIIRSEVSGKRAIHPAITVRYTVRGITRSFTTDLFAPGFGVRSNRRDQAEKLVAEYPAGDSVLVYVNPNNPLQARLHVGPRWDNFMKIGLALLLLGYGCWNVLLFLGSQREKIT